MELQELETKITSHLQKLRDEKMKLTPHLQKMVNDRARVQVGATTLLKRMMKDDTKTADGWYSTGEIHHQLMYLQDLVWRDQEKLKAIADGRSLL